MASTTTRHKISFPTSTDQYSPLESVFATQAASVDTALISMERGLTPVVADAAARLALYPTPTVGTKVERLDTKHIERWTGSAWQIVGTSQPVTFTPNIQNVTVGNGSITGLYTVGGGRCAVNFALLIGSTTAVGSNPRILLPVAANPFYGTVANAQWLLGMSKLHDIGNSVTVGTVTLNSAADITRANVDRLVISGTNMITSSINASAPFVWGTGDILNADFSFAVA